MLQKYSTWKVMQVFFDEPSEEHNMTDISKKSGLSHTSVKNHIEELRRMNMIRVRKEKRGERVFPKYSAETENSNYKTYKKIDTLHRLHKSELADTLWEYFQPDCIVLFGSAARGEDTEESDIDIYIQSEEEDKDLGKFEKTLKRKIQLHFESDFSSYPKELRNNIINGVLLHGFLEVLN